VKRTLAGKAIVITGAAGGIGSLVARELVETERASCILVDRNARELRRLADELSRRAVRPSRPSHASRVSHDTAPTRVTSYEVDLSDPAEVRDFARVIDKEPVSGLVNNAGIVHALPFASTPLGLFRKTLDVNLMAAVQLTQLLLPSLVKQRGAIVNVASGAGLVAPAGLSAYAASKFALVGFSEALRAELRGEVSVSAICPAFVATSLVQNSMSDQDHADPEPRARTAEVDQLVKRLGIKPKRVSSAIINALKDGPGTVPVSATTRLLWMANKFLPNSVGYLNHLAFRKAVDKGLFEN
jgi:short-subunit dehydrogenase